MPFFLINPPELTYACSFFPSSCAQHPVRVAVCVSTGRRLERRASLPARTKSIENSETKAETEKLYHSQKKIGKWTIFFAVRGVFIRSDFEFAQFRALWKSAESSKAKSSSPQSFRSPVKHNEKLHFVDEFFHSPSDGEKFFFVESFSPNEKKVRRRRKKFPERRSAPEKKMMRKSWKRKFTFFGSESYPRRKQIGSE